MLEARLDFCDPLMPEGMVIANPESVIEAWSLDDVPAAVAELEAAWEAGKTAIGFIAYEAASAFESVLKTRPADPGLPLLWFLVGTPSIPVDLSPDGYVPFRVSPQLTEDAYCQTVSRIMEAIRDGETYQLNFTFPMRAEVDESVNSTALYERLRRAQSANYVGRLSGKNWEILSASPELFFRIEDGWLETRPMKGTRPRGRTTAEDAAITDELQVNIKERAENVMIVDLLRNDVGRIAEPGSVTVPGLFELEQYPTVWQMTSRVRGRLRSELGLSEILAALFPCGSVTGAPKRRTMEWISETEVGPRGAYCGAIGALLPNRQAVFNVPIRTMTIRNGRDVQYPVGSGIVADADLRHEYAECLAKARVLGRASEPCFQLLETIFWSAGDGYVLLDRHLARIADSAIYFGWHWDDVRARELLAAASVDWDGDMRVRLLGGRDGAIEIQAVLLVPLPDRCVRLALAKIPVDSMDPFLFHKTTHRAVYADAVAQIAATGVDDVVLFNERGELTETTIGNIALKLAGEWVTPPIQCGVLAGTRRAEELASGRLAERILTKEDLNRAEAIEVMNSVRGKRAANFTV